MLEEIPSHYIAIVSTIVAIFMGVSVMMMRMRAHRRPINEKRIIIPPVAMSTGALMFIYEPFRVAPMQILEVFVLGACASLLLIWKTQFEVREDGIYLKKSKAFLFILVGLLVVRVIAKLVMQNSIDFGELAGMFFLLAFSMIACWRIAMFIKFKKIKATIQ
ncbi:CcdC family protein [Caryophanon latum]|uniref:Cytochrome c biogenesis protein CcdC n=1 Tax=Caryophanon latum TaxID=33977 RepID=A0A1C0YTD1_9BACL|nr:cytochrome c biogenesis protein CcdC [Caryophanon latum]OCS90399.1 hypothetical protein A6K76_11065 [Caryophanon latum]